MEYLSARPSQAITLSFDLGVANTGKTIVYDVLQTNGTVLTNNGATTEIGATGIYTAPYTVPATAQNLTVIAYDGATPIGESLSIDVLYSAATEPAGGTVYQTTYDAFVTRITTSIENYHGGGESASVLSSLQTYINQAIGAIQQKYGLLTDATFSVNTVSGQKDYNISTLIDPHPYKMNHIWYTNATAVKKPLTVADIAVVDADILNAETTLYRYATYKDGVSYMLRLNASPASVAGGLTIQGPYQPVYIGTGDYLPFEKKYDRLLETVVLAMAVEYLGGDTDKVLWEDKHIQLEAERIGLGGN